jgi:ribonuclease P protein subunit POP4
MREEIKLIRGELIGLRVSIARAKNKSLEGIKGKVVDETKNLLVIQTKRGEKKILKEQAIFRFELEGKLIEVNGRLLVGRPEERLKKKLKLRSRWCEL